MTIETLRAEYVALMGGVDNRLKESTLVRRIAEIKADRADIAKRAEEKAAEDEIKEAARQARIAQRGPLADHKYSTETNDIDAAAGWARRVLAGHEEKAAKFAEDFLKSPAHVMQWSDQYFSHAGEFEVAMEFKRGFEGGAEVRNLLDHATKQVMRAVGNTSLSSSPTSNLVNAHTTAAWSRLVELLQGRGFY